MTAFVSICLQCALAGLVIALPLTHPEALSFRVDAPRVLIPLPPKPPAPVVRVQHTEAPSTALSAAQPVTERPSGQTMLFHGVGITTPDAPSTMPIRFGSDTGEGIPAGLGMSDGRSPHISVTPARSVPFRVSSGMSQGMLLAPIRPQYPAIARAAGVHGTVVVEAVISRTGTIESLHVVSGPGMLQQAAVEAIRAARYRPYRLNGEAIEVQTTITVNFRMGG